MLHQPKRILPTALAASLALTVLASFSEAKKPPEVASARRFDREQFMVMNLNRGHGSSGYYLVTALRITKDVGSDLEKAARQLEQVDKSYARSRGKPDDRYLSTTSDKINAARKTAAELETKLRDAYQDLKASIQQTLVLEGSR